MMASMVEIEAKVRVSDAAAMQAALERMATFERTRVAEDVYFASADVPADQVVPGKHVVFRMRSVDGKHELTTKRKRLVGGMEISDEIDCPIPDPAAFRAFAEAIGFRPFVTKRKESRIYVRGELHLELNFVVGLGWFLEIEFLAPTREPEAVRQATNLVERTFLELGFRRDQFEPRLYIDLLRARTPASG
jgi:predicted adenylyl cyclase CyaB